ncbi:MAG TPA: Gfo/Idh/MocA family oxidoreductase [Pirellulales bacterium]|nr:Gfo/Idh/MocA family oxidoreductase [Pirellulales bacterium]
MAGVKKKVRYAVIGLGYFAQAAILPAFSRAKNSELTALVSGDSAKLSELGEKYGVELLSSYEDVGHMLSVGAVDAVYIALPNSMHREYTLRAAEQRVHVLCEKPMAVTEAECQEMIRACDENRVKLMIAYRLHFEAANLRAVEIAKSGQLGDLRFFSSDFSQQVKEGNIRLQRDLGGGTLYDLGVYCINAARYLFRDEPTEVFAFSGSNGEARFREVDEMTTCVLRFPNDRLATFTTSFGATNVDTFQLLGTKGRLRLDPAYDFDAKLKLTTQIEGSSKQQSFPKRDHVAAELIYFSDCILKDEPPEPDGWEGLADVRIVRALYHAAETGQPVRLEPFERPRRPEAEQQIDRPAGWFKPELVGAESPSGAS